MSSAHTGNLALHLEGTRPRGLAPVYDMLPMHFRPLAGGEVRDERFTPDRERLAAQPSAVEAARELWTQAAGDARISEGFRTLCRAQRALLD